MITRAFFYDALLPIILGLGLGMALVTTIQHIVNSPKRYTIVVERCECGKVERP